MLSVGEVVAY